MAAGACYIAAAYTVADRIGMQAELVQDGKGARVRIHDEFSAIDCLRLAG